MREEIRIIDFDSIIRPEHLSGMTNYAFLLGTKTNSQSIEGRKIRSPYNRQFPPASNNPNLFILSKVNLGGGNYVYATTNTGHREFMLDKAVDVLFTYGGRDMAMSGLSITVEEYLQNTGITLDDFKQYFVGEYALSDIMLVLMPPGEVLIPFEGGMMTASENDTKLFLGAADLGDTISVLVADIIFADYTFLYTIYRQNECCTDQLLGTASHIEVPSVSPNGLPVRGMGSIAPVGSSINSITLPATLDYIIGDSFANMGELNQVTLLSTIPPVYYPIYSEDIFAANLMLGRILVPVGCADAYKVADKWSVYADILEEVLE